MKTTHKLLMGLVMIFINGSCFNIANAASHEGAQRWDISMAEIQEVKIWHNLLEKYFAAEHQKYWPERKTALEEIVSEYPNSRWADDAALILACGKFEFEGKKGIDDLKSNSEAYTQGYFGNAKEAIKELRNIIKKYPNEKTIVSPWWLAGAGCRFDGVWIYTIGRLSFLNRDGSIREGRPFDKKGSISQQDKEVLAYFDHLDEYPVYTKDIAQLFITEILGHQGKFSDAALELEKVLSNISEFEKEVKADNVAASDPNGFLVRGLFRPEYRAYISLIGCYEKQEDAEKIVARTDILSPIVNQGAHYGMIRRVGEIYEKYGLRLKAKSQYQLALTKVNEYVLADRERSKHLEYIKPVTDEDISPKLENEISELKRLIK